MDELQRQINSTLSKAIAIEKLLLNDVATTTYESQLLKIYNTPQQLRDELKQLRDELKQLRTKEEQLRQIEILQLQRHDAMDIDSRPQLRSQWSGLDQEAVVVIDEIEKLLSSHECTLSHVDKIKFDFFKGTNIVQNPNQNTPRPSLLLSGLDKLSDSEISNVDEFCDLLLLLATSGMGKTRAIFQHLAKYFGLYFVPSDIGKDELRFHFGPRDFLHVENKLEKLDEIDPARNLKTVNQYIKCIVLSRVIILLRIMNLSEGRLTPLNWLIFQLKSSSETSIFVEMVKIVKNYKLEDLDIHLSGVREELHKFLPNLKRLPCVFDEAQYLLKLGIGKFVASDDLKSKRPLYSAVVNSVLNIFGNRGSPDQLDTSFWGSGTGLSITEAKQYSLSQVGRFSTDLNVEYHTITKILSDTEEVIDYISGFIGSTIDATPLHELDVFVGRRRFCASLVEQILLRNDPVLAIVETTKKLIDNMKDCWNDIIGRSNLNTSEINSLLDLSTRLLNAFMLSGRPIVVRNSNDTDSFLTKLFETGIGILEYFQKSKDSRSIYISLKEPFVMLSGVDYFKFNQNLMVIDSPSTTLSSLGLMWETCIAQAFINHTDKSNGKINISKAFGIEPIYLIGTILENPVTLRNWHKPTILEKRSIQGFFSDQKASPVGSPDNLAGPDGVLLFDNIPVFCQMKFRKECSIGKAFATLHPDNFYKNKNGIIPPKYEGAVYNIHSQIGKTVVRIVFCYPFVVKAKAWEAHFRIIEPREQRRGIEGWTFIDLLIDGRNAIDFFGSDLVGKFDIVREQAKLFDISGDFLEVSENEMEISV